MPTKDEIVKFYSEHRDDPAAIAAAMKQYGVGVRDASSAVGMSQQDFASYVNSGRKSTPVLGSGWDSDDATSRTWNYEEVRPGPKTKEDFLATVKPFMLGPDGKFLGPQSGVNYMLEGMTPDQAFDAANSIANQGEWSDDNRLGKVGAADQYEAFLDAGWREGPDNGGGVLGGLVRGASVLAKGVLSNPALSAAATAGLGSFLGSGVTSSGWYKPAVAAGKTALSGGNIGDAVKGAALSYAGSAAGDATKGIIGGAMGQVVGGVVKGAVTGQDLVSSLASGVTSAGINAFSANIPGFDELGDVQKSLLKRAITTALRGKKITPQLISSVMSDAAAAASKSKRG